jgi:hypothetical protein
MIDTLMVYNSRNCTSFPNRKQSLYFEQMAAFLIGVSITIVQPSDTNSSMKSSKLEMEVFLLCIPIDKNYLYCE